MALLCSYPVLQVRPYGVLVYEHKEFSKNWDLKRDRQPKEVKGYTGILTPYSKKKLKRSIGLMVASAKEKEAPNFKTGRTYKFKVNFITFTLPALQEGIEDKTIKRCLDNWIKRGKRKHKLNSYVWRAERQANGNIHFHMITDVWIHYEKIRDDWNACLRETGLVNKYKEKHSKMSLTQYLKQYPPTQKISKAARINAYKTGLATKWESPNSTDVHAVWKVRNLTQYFVKYMSKAHKDGEAPIAGKIWDCSKNLKTKENCWMLLEGEVRENFDYIMRRDEVERITDPLFTIAFIPKEKWSQYIGNKINSQWVEYLNRIRNDCEEVR